MIGYRVIVCACDMNYSLVVVLGWFGVSPYIYLLNLLLCVYIYIYSTKRSGKEQAVLLHHVNIHC